MSSAADLPAKKYLNLAAIKTMVAGAEAEAKKRNVEVTICIVDESGNLLFLQKADAASLTPSFGRRKKPGTQPSIEPLQGRRRRSEERAMLKSWLFRISFLIKAGFQFRWMAKRSAASPPAARNPKLMKRLPRRAWTRSSRNNSTCCPAARVRRAAASGTLSPTLDGYDH